MAAADAGRIPASRASTALQRPALLSLVVMRQRNAMASGFLVLPDGRCLARRWSAYDKVVGAVADQLGEEQAAQQLKQWLLEQLPGPNDEEELGYGAWFRTADQQVVARYIDLRQMTMENQQLFCEAAKRAALGDHPEDWL